MILEAYACYDTKVEAFMTPYFFRSKGEALRAFGEAANDPKSDMSKHSGDYVLHRLGTYDDSNGRLDGRLEPICVVAELVLKDVSAK